MNLQLKIACLDSMQEGTKYEAYKITISVFTQHIFPTHHPTPKTQLTHTPVPPQGPPHILPSQSPPSISSPLLTKFPQSRTNSLPAPQTFPRSPLPKRNNILHPLPFCQLRRKCATECISNTIYTDDFFWCEDA
jgi:hypothetical protein